MDDDEGEIEIEGDNLTSPSTLIFAGEELEIERDNVTLSGMSGAGSSGVIRLVE